LGRAQGIVGIPDRGNRQGGQHLVILPSPKIRFLPKTIFSPRTQHFS
jgi:hypothetical protein